MAWRLSKVSVTTSQAPVRTWRIANISAGVASTTWRVANVSAALTQAPPSTWRVARVAAAIVFGWRVANLSVLTAQSTTPQIAPLGAATVDPVAPYSVTAKPTGIQPDTYTWHLGTTSGGSDLDSLLTVSGATATFPPPGKPAQSVVYLSCTPSTAGSAGATQTGTYTVLPTPYYYRGADGSLRPMSLPYYLKG